MMKYIYSGAITLLFLGAVLIPSAQAQTTTSVTSMFEQIKALMLKVQELQNQLMTLRGDVRDVIKDGLGEGMTDADIAKVQELLATDSEIYPEGKVTGYFGVLTKEALKRFQTRHNLEVTGSLNEETRDLLEEYLGESFNGKIPAGLLRAPGIAKKVEARFLLGCDKRQDDGKVMGHLCKKLQSNDDSDDDSNDEELEVEIEIEDGNTKVEFSFEGDDYSVTIDDSTDIDDVLDAVAEELDVEVVDLDTDLKNEIKDKHENALDNADDDGDFNLEIEVEDGDTIIEFTFEGKDYSAEVDNSTDLEDILDAAADAIDAGDDASDLDDDLADAIEDMLTDTTEISDAIEALDDAETAIEEAEDAIEDADNDVDTEPADDLVDDAKDKLAEAQSEFDDENYDEAVTLANEATELAEDAEVALSE